MKEITSLQNPFVKSIIKLQGKSKERKKQGLFLIEGKREIEMAINSKYAIKSILFCEDLMTDTEFITSLDESTEIISITKEIYEKLAYRSSTEGIIALTLEKKHGLEHLSFGHDYPLILVAEGIEKPGNLGALLRTADAANVDAVIIADPRTDLYNPNIIRSSVGCVFSQQIALDNSERVIEFLKSKKVNIFSATLQNSNVYYEHDYRSASAIVVGTEATGLSEIWREAATHNINIPMQGKIDSMNVSVAAAIIIFEAKRQRNFN